VPVTAGRALIFLPLCLLGLVGCDGELNNRYGLSRPAGSVNGTEVLAALFRQAGHKVTRWSRFSPRLESKDCIVWFSQRMTGPGDKQRKWVERWLKAVPHRTFIYVGRDYDAAIDYWTLVREETSGDEHRELSREIADALEEYQRSRGSLDEKEDAGWFQIDRTRPRRKLNKLEGDAHWLQDVDATKADITLNTRFDPPEQAQILLRQDNDVVVSRQEIGQSQLVVATNGSFLLNMPLVNHQNRKLAAALVNQIGVSPQQVVFLETRLGDPSVYDEEPEDPGLRLFRFFGLEPLSFIMLHLALLGAAFVFARAPIFGIARVDANDTKADFGQHIEALGKLLERKGDAPHAQAIIEHYENRVHHATSPLAAPTRAALKTVAVPSSNEKR
jgi:hypothetical protein